MFSSDLAYTMHGQRRKNQRCKTNAPLDILLMHFDNDIYVGRGVWAWSVSREHAEALQDSGIIDAAMASRLDGLVLLIAEDTGEVVSLLRGSGRLIGRYFSRRYH